MLYQGEFRIRHSWVQYTRFRQCSTSSCPHLYSSYAKDTSRNIWLGYLEICSYAWFLYISVQIPPKCFAHPSILAEKQAQRLMAKSFTLEAATSIAVQLEKQKRRLSLSK